MNGVRVLCLNMMFCVPEYMFLILEQFEVEYKKEALFSFLGGLYCYYEQDLGLALKSKPLKIIQRGKINSYNPPGMYIQEPEKLTPK